MRYYDRMGKWFEQNGAGLVDYPVAAKYASAEAARFREGARQLAAGTHERQTSGEWK